MLHGAVELALDIAILWAPSGPGGALLTGGPVDPRFGDAPMAQVFQRAVPGRHVEVALREADGVPRAPGIPQMKEEVLHNVLRGICRADEAQHVLAQVAVVGRERRFPRPRRVAR